MSFFNNQSTIAENGLAFSKVLIAVCGVYCWEFLITLWFDWSFIFSTPRRRLKLPYVSYFICRYSFLASVIILVTLYHITREVNCQAVAQGAQVLLNISLGMATLNLLFRAWVFWQHIRIILVGLLIVTVGHWTLLIWNMFSIQSTWDNNAGMCLVNWTKQESLIALYIYTIMLNLLISILSVIGVWRNPPTDHVKVPLFERLGQQGICYFGATCTANLIPIFFLALNLNPVMDVISIVPACCMTVIAASRAVTVMAALTEAQNHGAFAGAAGHPQGAQPMEKRFNSSELPSEMFARTRPIPDDEASIETVEHKKAVPRFGLHPVVIDIGPNRTSEISNRSSNTFAEYLDDGKDRTFFSERPRR